GRAAAHRLGAAGGPPEDRAVIAHDVGVVCVAAPEPEEIDAGGGRLAPGLAVVAEGETHPDGDHVVAAGAPHVVERAHPALARLLLSPLLAVEVEHEASALLAVPPHGEDV